METTIIRRMHVVAMLVGPIGGVTDKVAAEFERGRVEVVRVAHAAAACERLAVAMPQVVVVLGTLLADEREAIADRATAVGAAVMYFDPELDQDTLEELVAAAARTAIERKLRRDQSAPAGSLPETQDGDDVDGNW